MPSIAKIFGAWSVRPGNKIRVICRIYTPDAMHLQTKSTKVKTVIMVTCNGNLFDVESKLNSNNIVRSFHLNSLINSEALLPHVLRIMDE